MRKKPTGLGMPCPVPHQFLRCIALTEGGLARQQEVESAAQAVNVGPDVHVMAVIRLFRQQIVGRAKDIFVVFLGQHVLFVVEEPRQAHVEDFDHAGAVDEDIARFDVAMDKAGLVGVV